jgi:hypothetical protein
MSVMPPACAPLCPIANRKEGRRAVGLHACRPTYRNLTTSVASRARMSASGVKRTLAVRLLTGLVVLDPPYRQITRSAFCGTGVGG